MNSRWSQAVRSAAVWWSAHDGEIYASFALACTLFMAGSFYGYMLFQTDGVWSAPLDDVFIHFDYARSFARGFPFHWSEGNGYSSGNTSLTYPVVLALGYWSGFRGLSLMFWAACIACASIVVFLVASGSLVVAAIDAPLDARTPSLRWIRFLIPPLVLSMGALDWTLFSGMENAFHLGVWGVALLSAKWQSQATTASQAQRRAWLVGVAGAVLVATRPESGVCVAALAFFCAYLGHRRDPSRGWRHALKVIVAIGVPGVLFLVAHGTANLLLTGEWAANGSVAKLFLNDPFMNRADKWERYRSLLSYLVPRLVLHHFGEHSVGLVVPALAVIPLLSRRTRPVAVFLWVQIVVWVLVVSLNNQARWHNERYAMPAVAWMLVLAAIGVGLIAGGGYGIRLERATLGRIANAGVARVGAAGLLLGLYAWGQVPRHKDQQWFFGRACRNILDQHVTAGRVLERMGVKRVLVGDAGALIYASDRPGLDLIGLGGYHAYPFARATVQGLGASLELIERLPESERPDVMAIYPSWWGDLPTLFGTYLTAVPVHGNVICGGAEKVIYEADWGSMDRRGLPRALLDGEHVFDQLDVADLISEKNHGYNFPQPHVGYVRYHVLPDPADGHRDLFDAGRNIPPGYTERAQLLAPPGAARLIVRVATDRAFTTDVTVNGAPLGALEAAGRDGWQELSINLPDEIEGQFEIGLTPRERDGASFHVWVVQR